MAGTRALPATRARVAPSERPIEANLNLDSKLTV